MGLLFGTEKRTQPTFAEPPIPAYPGADVFGRPSIGAHPDSALVVPTVWACVGLLSNAVSMLPLETYRKTDGVPSRVADPQVVASPAAGMTQSEWLHMLMVSLLLRGNAVGRIVGRDGMQRATQIELQHPDKVTLDVDRDNGALIYKIDNKRVPTADIWHVRGLTMPGSKVGLSPIGYAAATLGVDVSSRQFAQDYFAGGGIPKAVIKTVNTVDQAQARTVKDKILAATRSREPVVLGDGVDYQQIQVNPEESQFLATQKANVSQIARYFWIPPEMVGGESGGSMTYANVEQRSLDFLTYAVSFWLKRIEDAVFPLLPQPQYVRFNTEALLRTDAETQARVNVVLLAGKVVVPSEVRAKYSLPPMTDDQKKEADMVPLAITPTGGAKALPAAKTPPGPTAPVPTDEGDPNAA